MNSLLFHLVMLFPATVFRKKKQKETSKHCPSPSNLDTTFSLAKSNQVVERFSVKFGVEKSTEFNLTIT